MACGYKLHGIFYKPARQGQKVAYLSFAQFLFLVVALIGVVASSHGSGEATSNSDETSDAPVAEVRS